MELSLKGKVAVTCGSTQGIGKAAAIELAALGADVILLARNEEKLQAVLQELPHVAGQRHGYALADFADSHSVKAVAQRLALEHPQIHILVNNTGGPAAGTAIEAEPEAFVQAFYAHLVCSQHLVQAFVPGMRAAGYGRIINVISTSVKAPIAGLGVSNTVRAAVANWAKTLSVELGQYGITVNNVLPGLTKTARLEALFATRAQKAGLSVAAYEESVLQTHPARRFAEADEVAAAIAFLASPAAAYINGINLPVDGGSTPNL